MKIKTVSWILIIAMIFSQFGMVPEIVSAETIVPSSNAVPDFVYGGQSNWKGGYPKVGDSVFYAEVKGTNLNDLSAEVSVYDGSGYTAVASQTNRWYLGKTAKDEERYICEMTVNGGGSLASTTYYVRLKDSSDTYYDNNNAYFSCYDELYIFIDTVDVPTEISTGISTVPFEINLYGADGSLNKDNLSLKLYSGTKDGYWGDVSLNTLIGTLEDEDYELSIIGGGSYNVKGEFTITTAPSHEDNLYIEVDYDGNKVYTGNPIYVVSDTALGQFKLTNAIAARASMGGGHHEGMGQGYEAIDNSAFYICDTVTSSAHKFTFTGGYIDDESLFSVTDNNGINILRTGTVDVNASAYGIYTATGMLDIPGNAESIIFNYNDNTIHTVFLERTQEVGSISVNPVGYEKKKGTYLLPADTTKFKVAISGINLPPSESSYSATLDDNVISCAIDSTDGQLVLELSSPVPLNNAQWLSILLNGTEMYNLGYEEGTGLVPGMGGPSGMNITFGETVIVDDDPIIPPALTRISGNRDLVLYGSGFDSGKSYTAHFMEHSVNGLSASPQQLSATFISNSKLTISKTLTDSLARGWYEVFITEDDTQINGFSEAVLLPAEDAVIITNPTVKINNGEAYTLQQQVNIIIAPGSFTDVRFSENQADLSNIAFKSIESSVSYTLSEGYGNKTIYFEFKNQKGNTYNASASINYRSAVVPGPSVCGIIGLKGNEPLLLNKFGNYSLYVQSDGVGNIANAELLDENDNVIASYILNRTAVTGSVNTYSKLINFNDSTIKKLRFYLVDSFGLSSDYTEIAVNVAEIPYINSYRADIATNYHGTDRYAEWGSEIKYTLRGKKEHIASASLKYKDSTGTERISDTALTEDSYGIYSAAKAIPTDAAELISIEYKLTDPNLPTNFTVKTEERSLIVSATVKFSGLNNTGNFDGKYLRVNQINGGSYYKYISDGQTEFNFNKLTPDSYFYSLYDAANIYKSGQFTAASGINTSVDLSDALKPASICFNISGGTVSSGAYIRYSYKSGENTYYDYATPNNIKYGLYEGMVIDSYELFLPYDDLKIYSAPSVVTTPITLAAGANTHNVAVTPLSTVSLTVKVNDKNVVGRIIPQASVSLTQAVTNGDTYFFYSASASTDKNGLATFTIYPDCMININVSKDNYNNLYYSYTADSESTQNSEAELKYADQNRLKLNSYSKALQFPDEEYDASKLLESNNSLEYVVARDSAGNNINSYTANSYQYFINDCFNQTVKLYPYMKPGFVSEKEYYTVTLDEYGNGSVDIVALPKGIVTAYVPKSGDNPPASYMLIYDSKGRRASTIIDSDGKLSSAAYNLEAGQYTAVIFSGYNLTDLSGLSEIGVFDSYGLTENVHYSKKAFTIEHGKAKSLGEISLPSLVNKNMLMQYSVVFDTKYIPSSAENMQGMVYVKARVIVNELLKSSMTLKAITAYDDYNRNPKNKTVNGKASEFGRLNYTPDAEGNYVITYTCDLSVGKLQNNTSLRLSFERNGIESTSMFYKLTDTPYVNLVAPKQVAGQKSEITVRGVAFADSTVEIYDGEILIGTAVANGRHSYSTNVALASAKKNSVHTLTAKMKLSNGEAYSSAPVSCEIIDDYKRATISNYEFSNVAHLSDLDHPSIKVYNVSDLGNMPGGVYTYYPYGKSRVSFRINKLISSQLENVYVINTDTSGNKTKYPAELVEDDLNGDYSDWKVETCFGHNINNLSVFYSLKADENMGLITGFHAPSEEQFNASLNNINKIEPANILPSYRDPNGAIITEQTPTSLKAHKNFGSGKIGIEVDYTNVSGYSEAQLIAQGFRKIPVGNAGEFYLLKDSSSTVGYDLRVTRTMYLSEGLASAMTKGTDAYLPDANSGILADNDFVTNLASLSPEFMSLNISEEKIYAASGKDTVRNIAGKVDYVGYLQNTGEIAYEAFRNRTTDLGKFGTGMQMVGGAALAAQIFTGPASIDPANLKALAENIKDFSVRSRIVDEIYEYQYARRDSHSISSLMGVVSYGSSFFSLPGKCLSYVVSTGSMVYSEKIDAEYNLWGNGIIAQITMQLRKEGQDIGEEDDPDDPQWLMDPSGYVFEAVENQRIEGIKATAQTDTGGSWTAWNDDALIASEQDNPQTTDINGKYGWDVPVGNWRVLFEDASKKYQTALSKSMTVPPAHTEVNIGLISTEQPRVSDVSVDPSGLEIEFSKYMQSESIYDSKLNLANVQVFETVGGEAVPCDTIDFIVSAENNGYKADATYQEDVIASDTFVKRIRFNADTSLYPGGFKLYEDDGITKKQYSVIVSGNVLSYSGVSMGDDYTNNNVTANIRQSAAEPVSNISGGSYADSQTVSLSTGTSGADIYYTTNGTAPTTSSNKYKSPITISESCILQAFASKVGMNDSTVFSAQYNIGSEAPRMVSMIVASPGGGIYSIPQAVTLSTTTENADIYYTLDGTTPTAASMKYSGSIVISASATLKAIGMKSGFASSNVMKADYTINSGGSNHKPNPKSEQQVPTIPQIPVFKDVSVNDWFYDSVNYVVAKGLFKGISDDKFAPYNNVTRAMIVTVLYRLAGSPEAEGTSFADIQPGSWYEKAVIWASNNGLVSGYGNGIFGPNDDLTREQLAAVIFRYTKLMGYNTEAPSNIKKFADDKDISDWAVASISWMSDNSLINGKLNNMLDPKGTATRAETAAILYRFIVNIIK